MWQLSVTSPIDFGRRVVVTEQLADKNFCYTIPIQVCCFIYVAIAKQYLTKMREIYDIMPC